MARKHNDEFRRELYALALHRTVEPDVVITITERQLR